MKRRAMYFSWILLLFATGAGCANRDEESSRVARLESGLAETRLRLDESSAAIAELREKMEQSHAALDALTAELVKVKVERDQLKQEVAAFRRKRR
jgi:uncharacterized coiled-coil protein SlyX